MEILLSKEGKKRGIIMKKSLISIFIIFVIVGCGLNEAGKEPKRDVDRKIILHYPNGKKQSEYDHIIREYIEWYENSQMKFIATEWAGKRNLVDGHWISDFSNYIKKYWVTEPHYWQNYDREIRILIKGEYNHYEGWYPNGQKKFEYIFKPRKYIECDKDGNNILNKGY